jgi:hypothetical protein
MTTAVQLAWQLKTKFNGYLHVLGIEELNGAIKKAVVVDNTGSLPECKE